MTPARNVVTKAAELLKLAKDATPGPWTMLYTFGSKDLPCSIVHGDVKTVLEWNDRSTSSTHDVEFIAACSPEAITELMETLLRYREALEKINCGKCCGGWTWPDIDCKPPCSTCLARQALNGAGGEK
jgi:hypothetical protein